MSVPLLDRCSDIRQRKASVGLRLRRRPMLFNRKSSSSAAHAYAVKLDHMFAWDRAPVSQYAGLSRVAPGVPAPSLMHRRRVLDKSITYVGLDVHKDTIAVALAEAGVRGDVREYGKVANTPAAVKALATKLSRVGNALRFCYEAGPCGYGIQRQLTLAGHDCVVVAPSLIPRKPGDRIKTDRRDAINLAKLHRAGELTAVWVPDRADEAIRDLVRARWRRRGRAGPSALSGFLLRHGRHYNRPAWTLMHRRWMAGLNSSKRRIISCWKTASPQSRRRRCDATVWKLISRRRCRIGRWPRWCAPCKRYAGWLWSRRRR